MIKRKEKQINLKDQKKLNLQLKRENQKLTKMTMMMTMKLKKKILMMLHKISYLDKNLQLLMKITVQEFFMKPQIDKNLAAKWPQNIVWKMDYQKKLTLKKLLQSLVKRKNEELNKIIFFLGIFSLSVNYFSYIQHVLDYKINIINIFTKLKSKYLKLKYLLANQIAFLQKKQQLILVFEQLSNVISCLQWYQISYTLFKIYIKDISRRIFGI
ncbi:transmembrane protein, putative (macronuclear) [Tetrahymena thermophila SB210]|uniref:Transmembrane protein, putative n=1 Tax=Tetrahymena thermophila (strain SB210) TaxID=312017 RepID=W7XGE5_TETTS|nr:transmembrane protein, putative [Tetrahymena thermophila SB210]EWS71959.1 transmembrane protein, putative [Tetrahymena thermophila SB210]|eukprot:XP_012655519.1 transmembrane protein, putative [Tetrahymena thermophila SB210]